MNTGSSISLLCVDDHPLFKSGLAYVIERRSDTLVLTPFGGDAEVQRALAAGARGYILKSSSAEELVDAIRQVHAGKTHLAPRLTARLAQLLAEDPVTHREISVLQLIARGNRNKDIADQLCIAEDTVKGHIKHIMEKLGARDRTHSVTIALQRGIIQL